MHDSGPGRVASPSPYGSFIRYSMSVYPDAFGPSHFQVRCHLQNRAGFGKHRLLV